MIGGIARAQSQAPDTLPRADGSSVSHCLPPEHPAKAVHTLTGASIRPPVRLAPELAQGPQYGSHRSEQAEQIGIATPLAIRDEAAGIPLTRLREEGPEMSFLFRSFASLISTAHAPVLQKRRPVRAPRPRKVQKPSSVSSDNWRSAWSCSSLRSAAVLRGARPAKNSLHPSRAKASAFTRTWRPHVEDFACAQCARRNAPAFGSNELR